ncbi:MAG TPA: hypothetical protein VIF14_14040 [Alphaproteobacteria bacterium]
MPHDAMPRNGRIDGSGVPGWAVALALAVFFLAAAVLAFATGAFIILLPALALVAVGYGVYAMIAARRRRARFGFGLPARRWGVIRDARALRRRSRLAGDAP